MTDRMIDFVEYSVGDFNINTFKYKLASNPIDRSTLFSPSLSHIFNVIIQQVDPGRNINISESSLIESSLYDAAKSKSVDNLISYAYDLELGMMDRADDDIVLEKLQTICAIQVKLGTERIRETFRFIFETIFKKPFCLELSGKLVKWSSKLPAILETRLEEDNKMLKDINTHIAMISRVLG